MGYAFDHTGDIGVDVEAASLDELFAEAAEAFSCTVADPSAVRAGDLIAVRLAAGEVDLLLRDWLSELLFEFDAHGFLPVAARVSVTRTAGEWRLDAEVSGERAGAVRVPLKVLVKAITYHALEVRETAPGCWRARLVFDI